MRLLTCLLCAISLCVVGCGNGDSGGGSPSTTPPDSGTPDNTSADSGFAQAMISAHNEVRASATPAPNPALPPLTWSTAAAQKAQARVELCKLEPNPDLGGFGENVLGTTANAARTAQVVQQAWGAESASYDYDKNTCASGKQCTEYTQLVWRDTTQVGCAVKLCDKNSPFATVAQWELWVCYYSPPGNQGGLRPY
jgi:uncharacterized protein YkwD